MGPASVADAREDATLPLSRQRPAAVVTGFPNSGTSFLCHLISLMGFSPGSSKNLKGADEHNRWGYFEHLPVRRLVRKAAGWARFQPAGWESLASHKLKGGSLRLSYYRLRIRLAARLDNVQVYKDNSIPLVHTLFPDGAKYVAIRRRPSEVYKSPGKAGFDTYNCSLEDLERRMERYAFLVEQMGEDVDLLKVSYMDFLDDLDGAISAVANHLGVELTADRLEACREAFRPRSG